MTAPEKVDWPYDAKQDDPLTALRIPVVSTLYPRWFYLVSVCINPDPETPLWHGLRPDDHETALIRSLIDFSRAWYNPGYVAREFDTRPFDLDGGFNSLTLIKRGKGDWAFRRRTWEWGPVVVPETWNGREKPADLAAVLDRIHSWGDGEYNPRWVAWKVDHASVFGAVE
jgi:hypothetical protein